MDVYGTNRMIYSSMGRQSNRENVVPFGSLRSEPPRPIDSTLRLDMTRSTARLHVVLIHQILGVMHHDIVHALRLVCLARLKAPSGGKMRKFIFQHPWRFHFDEDVIQDGYVTDLDGALV